MNTLNTELEDLSYKLVKVKFQVREGEVCALCARAQTRATLSNRTGEEM